MSLFSHDMYHFSHLTTYERNYCPTFAQVIMQVIADSFSPLILLNILPAYPSEDPVILPVTQ
ncbi:MAG: hypothetical protein JWM14_2291 [Chitinophagaceae bacterium]|nr:hypothetical protein [Chitinophagaceae bacterium]